MDKQPSDFFKITLKFCSLLGLWPNPYQNGTRTFLLYELLFAVTYFLGSMCIILSVMEDYVFIHNRSSDIQTIVGSMGLNILWSTIMLRSFNLKKSQTKDLVERSLNLERKVISSKDEGLIAEFSVYASKNRFINSVYIVAIGSVYVAYCFIPIFLRKEWDVDKKALPILAWMPFNQDEHYAEAYFLKEFFGFFVTMFVIGADIYNFSLILFSLAQLKVIQYVLKNFDKYVIRTQQQLNCGLSEARFITLRECIILHQNMIRYVQDYNNLLRQVALCDAIQSSMQLSATMLDLMRTGARLTSLIKAICMVTSMLVRLLTYYWYADFVSFESGQISQALMESNWTEQPKEIQQMMVFVILRSNRELVMEIGHFTNMSVNVFIKIMKASYSYFSLVCGTK